MRKGDLCLLCTNSRDAILLNRNEVGTSNGVTHPRAHFSPFRVSALEFLPLLASLLLLVSLLLLAPILLITSLLLQSVPPSGIPVVVWRPLLFQLSLLLLSSVKPAVLTAVVPSLKSLHAMAGFIAITAFPTAVEASSASLLLLDVGVPVVVSSLLLLAS